MDEVAKRTGGIAFYGRNNLDAGIQAAIDDAVAGYTLGFYAPQDRTQAGFHKLTVRSLRPGVTLRYKEGYYGDHGCHGHSHRRSGLAAGEHAHAASFLAAGYAGASAER